MQPTTTGLIKCFIWQLWYIPELGVGATWACIYSAFPALLSIADHIINMMVINVAVEGKQKTLLGFFALALAGSFSLRHLLALRMRDLKLGGKATQYLRGAIFDTMIQFTPASQAKLPDSSVTLSVFRDVDDAVGDVWVTFFKFIASIVEVFFNAIFFLVVACLHHEAIWILVVPFVIIICNVAMLKQTKREQRQLKTAALARQNTWVSFLAENCELRAAVTNYRKTHDVSVEFQHHHKKANAANFRCATLETRILWVSKWFSVAIGALLVYILGVTVINGNMEVGTMIAMLGGVKALGANIGKAFTQIYTMTGAQSSIERIAELLNSDTRRKMLFRAAMRREEMLKTCGESAAAKQSAFGYVRVRFADAKVGLKVTMTPAASCLRGDPRCGVVAVVDHKAGRVAVRWDDSAETTDESREWWDGGAEPALGSLGKIEFNQADFQYPSLYSLDASSAGPPRSAEDFTVGGGVEHVWRGRGTVEAIDGEGTDKVVRVLFANDETHDYKPDALDVGKLQPLEDSAVPPSPPGELAKCWANTHRDGMIIQGLCASIPAGRMVLFSHQAGDSKQRVTGTSTLLQLIVRHILPTQGYITFPADWRLRYLTAEPLIFPRSLWYNLTFGVQHLDEAGKPLHSKEEVKELCQLLGLPKPWLDMHLGADEQEHPDRASLGHGGRHIGLSKRILISIARVLLSSPQLLLIDKALDPLGASGATKCAAILRELVRLRGLRCLPTDLEAIPQYTLRKPCTVIVSTSIPEIYQILAGESGDGIKGGDGAAPFAVGHSEGMCRSLMYEQPLTQASVPTSPAALCPTPRSGSTTLQPDGSYGSDMVWSESSSDACGDDPFYTSAVINRASAFQAPSHCHVHVVNFTDHLSKVSTENQTVGGGHCSL